MYAPSLQLSTVSREVSRAQCQLLKNWLTNNCWPHHARVCKCWYQNMWSGVHVCQTNPQTDRLRGFPLWLTDDRRTKNLLFPVAVFSPTVCEILTQCDAVTRHCRRARRAEGAGRDARRERGGGGNCVPSRSQRCARRERRGLGPWRSAYCWPGDQSLACRARREFVHGGVKSIVRLSPSN